MAKSKFKNRKSKKLEKIIEDSFNTLLNPPMEDQIIIMNCAICGEKVRDGFAPIKDGEFLNPICRRCFTDIVMEEKKEEKKQGIR